MNTKGIAEHGVVTLLVMILTAAGASGALYGGGNPVASGFTVGTSALTYYSQMPHVKEKFRKDKAVGLCKESGQTDCDVAISGMDNDQILDYIRDDDPTQTGFAVGPKAPNFQNISKFGHPGR